MTFSGHIRCNFDDSDLIFLKIIRIECGKMNKERRWNCHRCQNRPLSPNYFWLNSNILEILPGVKCKKGKFCWKKVSWSEMIQNISYKLRFSAALVVSPPVFFSFFRVDTFNSKNLLQYCYHQNCGSSASVSSVFV